MGTTHNVGIVRVNNLPDEPQADLLYITKPTNQHTNLHLPLPSGHLAVACRRVILNGPKRLPITTNDQTSTANYTFSNLDSFTEYNVSISEGNVEVLNLDDTESDPYIEVTAPMTPGTIYLTVNGETSPIEVYDPYVIDLPQYPFDHYANMSIGAVLEDQDVFSRQMFGGAVALTRDGTQCFVTGINDDGTNTNPAIYVFKRISGSAWEYQQKLYIDRSIIQQTQNSEQSWLGITLAVSGDGLTLVAGDPAFSLLFIWVKDGDTWRGAAPWLSADPAVGMHAVLNYNYGVSCDYMSIAIDYAGNSITVGHGGDLNQPLSGFSGGIEVLTFNKNAGQITGIYSVADQYPGFSQYPTNRFLGIRVAVSDDGLLLAAMGYAGGGDGKSDIQFYTRDNYAANWSPTPDHIVRDSSHILGGFQGANLQFDKTGTMLLASGDLGVFVFVNKGPGQGWVETQAIMKPSDELGETPWPDNKPFAMNADATLMVLPEIRLGAWGSGTGAAYVYVRDGLIWTFKQRVLPDTGDSNPWFTPNYFGSPYWRGNGPYGKGPSIAVADTCDVFMVGDPMATVRGNTNQGLVFTYARLF